MTNVPSGMGVDASGGPVIDPTANVIALNAAGLKRGDDILSLHIKYQDILREKTEQHTEQVAALRGTYAERFAKLREEHAKDLRMAESDRLDKIRAVDTMNVSEAAKVVAAQQLALADQIQKTAEATRISTQALATSVSETLSTALKPLIDGLAEVQKRQYETAGAKTQQVETKGINQWTISAMVGIVAIFVSALVAVAIAIAAHVLG